MIFQLNHQKYVQDPIGKGFIHYDMTFGQLVGSDDSLVLEVLR